MPGWKDLFECLKEEGLRAEDIVERLGVTPTRLRQMLASKRLASALDALHAVAERKTGVTVGAAAVAAAAKLAKLASSGETKAAESARKACLDILETAKEAHDQARQRSGTFVVPRFGR